MPGSAGIPVSHNGLRRENGVLNCTLALYRRLINAGDRFAPLQRARFLGNRTGSIDSRNLVASFPSTRLCSVYASSVTLEYVCLTLDRGFLLTFPWRRLTEGLVTGCKIYIDYIGWVEIQDQSFSKIEFLSCYNI